MKYKLKEVRIQKGLTQVQLAEMSGISRPIISKLENESDTNTTLGTLKALAKALNVEVNDLFYA